MQDHDWEEITADTFDDSDLSSPEVLLRNLPLPHMCQTVDDMFEHVFADEEVTDLDVRRACQYLANRNIDHDHFSQFSERVRRALVGRWRLYEMHTIYSVLLKDLPDTGPIMEQMIAHAFFSGLQVATGCERTIDYVRKSIRHDDQRQKRRAGAHITARTRTQWKDEARVLYAQVTAANPSLTTATKILARMNEVSLIRGSSPGEMLIFVRKLRKEPKKSSPSLANTT